MPVGLRPYPIGLAALLLLTACPADDAERFIPFRDAWTTEVDGVPFPYLDADGAAQITTLTIGGTGVGNNFYNRGDIIVQYDASHDAASGSPGRITVEIRRFTGADNEGAADDDYGALHLWAYADGSPQKPSDTDSALDCSETWQEGCHVRIWYDGIDQPIRSGADIRVTLPSNYAHDVNIVTEDNDQDSNYLNRANVCIRDLAGSANVTLGSGLAFASLAADITPAPKCSDAQIQACETYQDTDGNDAAWDVACGCDTFGTLAFGTHGGAAANVQVDMPGTLWANMVARNEDSERRDNCTSSIDVPNTVPLAPSSGPWDANGESNHPSDAAPPGSGYGMTLSSDACAPVAHTENPGDFIGEDADPDEQQTDDRGNLEICVDCNRSQTCEELLPGGI